MPSTSIYSLDMQSNEVKVLLSHPRYLTSFNPEGYNNQPYFISDDRLLITSDYESMGLTDIYMLDLGTDQITRITATEESEYSATPMSDRQHFSLIRQELDDSRPIPQVLWKYPLDRSNGGSQVIPDLTNIGYHVWLTEDKLALFLVDDPLQLVLYDLRINSVTPITTNGGRCLRKDKDGNLIYVQMSETEGWEIRKYDIYLGRSRKICNTLPKQQDFELLPNGFLLAGDGSTLYTYQPYRSQAWQEVLDLSSTDIGRISRIAASKNKVAIVTSK